MPKKKKTREQKILADKRYKIVPLPHIQQVSSQTVEKQQEAPRQSYSFPPATLHTGHSLQSLPHTDLKYLTNDLKKTVVITAIIVISQILLHSVIS